MNSARTRPSGRPLRRAFTVLNALAESATPLTLSEISELTGAPKSTLHRIMRTLTDLDLVTRMESKSYDLGDNVSQLAQTRGQAKVQSLSARITPFLLELFQRTRKMVGVGMLSGVHVQHAGTLYDHDHSRLAAAWRRPVPAHCSAAGKLLLARTTRGAADLGGGAPAAYTQWTITKPERMRRELDLIRRTGLSYARSEYLPELVDVAAPVHLGSTRPVAAVVVAGTVNHTNLRTIGQLLLTTVGAIEENAARVG